MMRGNANSFGSSDAKSATAETSMKTAAMILIPLKVVLLLTLDGNRLYVPAG